MTVEFVFGFVRRHNRRRRSLEFVRPTMKISVYLSHTKLILMEFWKHLKDTGRILWLGKCTVSLTILTVIYFRLHNLYTIRCIRMFSNWFQLPFLLASEMNRFMCFHCLEADILWRENGLRWCHFSPSAICCADTRASKTFALFDAVEYNERAKEILAFCSSLGLLSMIAFFIAFNDHFYCCFNYMRLLND